MIVEALLYLRARLAGQPGGHGLLAEQVGIWARHRRQRQAWAGHLARARALCLRAAESLPADCRRTALVLGAGVLNDVPLGELSRLFQRVVLADAAFLPATIRQARRLGNVELRHADLTGVLDALPGAEALRNGCAAPVPDLSFGLADLDFAYSANLLSQLPLCPLAALCKRHPDIAEDILDTFGASLVRAHLDALLRLGCPACLVTDTEEREQRDGAPHSFADLLYGVRLDLPGESWTWNLAPRGEEHPHFDVERAVFGCPDVRAANPQEGRHAA